MSWDDYLSQYERQIESTERALDEGTPFDPAVLQPFEPPTDLGPFPLALQGRGAQVLERNRAIEARLRSAMGQITEELNAVGREAKAMKGYDYAPSQNIPKYFDQGA